MKAIRPNPSAGIGDLAGTNGSPEPLRILIFGINYAPEVTGIGPYTTELAEHLAEHGHEVEVVTGMPHYPEWRRMPVPQNTTVSPRVHRHWHYVPKRAGAFGRMLYELSWFLTAAPDAIRKHPDLVIGVVPSLSGGLLAVLAGRRNRACVGLIAQDLMGPAAAQSGYDGGRRVAGLTGLVERFVLRRCKGVAVVSDGFRDHLNRAGISSSRIHSVRNWTHPGEPTESIPECRRRLGWGPTDFICLHAGNMGKKQGLDNVLDAAALLKSSHIRFVLSGGGNDRGRLVDRASRMRLDNVSFLGLQEGGKYQAMLRAADVLLLNQRATVGDMALPSKLASYFAAGRPVAAAVALRSPAASELERSAGGIIVPAECPQALAKAILDLSLAPDRRAVLGSLARKYAEDQLTAESALRSYDQFVEQLVIGRRNSARSRAEKQGAGGLG